MRNSRASGNNKTKTSCSCAKASARSSYRHSRHALTPLIKIKWFSHKVWESAASHTKIYLRLHVGALDGFSYLCQQILPKANGWENDVRRSIKRLFILPSERGKKFIASNLLENREGKIKLGAERANKTPTTFSDWVLTQRQYMMWESVLARSRRSIEIWVAWLMAAQREITFSTRWIWHGERKCFSFLLYLFPSSFSQVYSFELHLCSVIVNDVQLRNPISS